MTDTIQYPPPPPKSNKGLIIALIALVGVLIAALVVGGVFYLLDDDDEPANPQVQSPSGPSGSIPPPGSTTPVEPSSPSTTTVTDEQFVAAIEDYFGTDLPDEDLVQLGIATCDAIDASGWDTFINQDIYTIASQLEITAEDYAFIVGASIATYCPEYGQYIQ